MNLQGTSQQKEKKNVATITINIDTNDSDSDIIIAEDEKHMSNKAIIINLLKMRIWQKSEGNKNKN